MKETKIGRRATLLLSVLPCFPCSSAPGTSSSRLTWAWSPARSGWPDSARYFIADIGLALAAMFALLRVGSSEAVLQRVGRVPSEVLMCAIILCVGPMVAIPRTSASTFEMAIAPNLPGVSAVVFSVLFFALILALCIRESAVVDIVGKVLTPLLLVGLAAIIIKGVVTPLGTIAAETKIDSAVVTGVKAGYQTMDALAALPFGILVLQSVIDKGYTESGKKFRIMSGSSILACVLLLAVYMGLAYLGATVSAQYDQSIGRAQLVMAIVEALMGKTGMIIFGIVVGLACIRRPWRSPAPPPRILPSSAAARCRTKCLSSRSACSAPSCRTSVSTALWPSPRRSWTLSIRRPSSSFSFRWSCRGCQTASAAARSSARCS